MSQLENKYSISESQIYEIQKHIAQIQGKVTYASTFDETCDNLESFIDKSKENAREIDRILEDLEVLRA